MFINSTSTALKMIPVAQPDFGGNELKYVQDCISTGWISSVGKYVAEFERNFSSFCKTDYGAAVCNGTVALHLALVALGIKQDDEVLVPNLTFIATANAVKYCEAKPVFIDVDKETWTIAPEDLERRITDKTKAIIPVHLYGHPCNMDKITSLAKSYNLFVIEDCAEAHGALYKNEPVGSFADAGCFSFFGNKIITCGEGGMVVTKNKELYERLVLLRGHAASKDKKYWHSEIGFNYRMTNIQAAIGVAQCERIDSFIEKKRQNAQIYNENLADCNSITLPPEKEWAKNVFWMYSVLLSPDAKLSRDNLLENLRTKGIDTRPFFYPLSDMPPYKSDVNTENEFPTTAFLSKQGFSLPSSALLTKEQIIFICNTIKEILNSAK